MNDITLSFCYKDIEEGFVGCSINRKQCGEFEKSQLDDVEK